MSQSEGLHPGFMPDSEIELPNDPSFVALCMADIEDHAKKRGWRIGNSILSWHERWGLVWRVDIQIKHEFGQSASEARYICWRPPDMKNGIGGTAFVFAKKEDRFE